MKKAVKEFIGVRLAKTKPNLDRKMRSTCLVNRMKAKVASFLSRDDNSRITTGKRDTITRNGEKRQRRVLLDSLQNLHSKYQAENEKDSMSYPIFCRLRPFNVTPPKPKDRQTCLCKNCENAALMLDKIKQLNLGVASDATIDTCAKLLCCIEASDKDQQNCYYRKCTNCKDNVICMSDDPSKVR